MRKTYLSLSTIALLTIAL